MATKKNSTHKSDLISKIVVAQVQLASGVRLRDLGEVSAAIRKRLSDKSNTDIGKD